MSQPWEGLYSEIEERLPAIMERLYERLFDDLMIGFLFRGHDREQLIAQQHAFTARALGSQQAYEGKSPQEAHAALHIFGGHFDRRHTILRETLVELELEPRQIELWLAFDRSFRSVVVAPRT